MNVICCFASVLFCALQARGDVGLDDFGRKARERIEAIRATPDRTVPAGAPCFYVSARKGDDAADGRSPSAAWRTLARLRETNLPSGSYVLLERGGVFRGSIRACAGVTYAAYGKGPKPVVCGSPEDGADARKWRQTENPKVWAYDIGRRDVGTLVFDGGKAHAVKVLIRTDAKTRRKTDQRTGRPFDSYRDLCRDLDFWHDYYENGTGLLYLCSETNPGKRFMSIEFCVKRNGISVGTNADVTVDSLCVKYAGAHGVGAGTCRNLTVSNCEFAWIGGSIQGEAMFGRDHPTRYGNGVEVYGGCDGFVVTNCIFREVYDAAVTYQYNIRPGDGMKRFDQRHVRLVGNVIGRCNYSVEYFLTAPNGNPSRMEDVLVADNLMFDAGFGYCEQRPDRGVAAHVKGRWRKDRNRACGFVLRDNAMCRSRDAFLNVGSALRNADGSSSLPRFEGNVLVASPGEQFGYVSETSPVSLPFGAEAQAVLDRQGPGNRLITLSPPPLAAAKWIGAPGNGTPALERDFVVTGAVRAAELAVAAPGFFEAYLDGVKVGDRVLDPSPTDFTKRVLFSRQPVAVTPGRHTLRLLLGHGWYDQRARSAWNNDRDRWRAEPCARAALHVTCADGSRQTIVTDGTWRQVKSPLAWDDLREGEIVDPGFVLPRPGLGTSAVEVAGPAGRLVEMTHPPARVVREIPVAKSWRVKDGWMLDFGENLSGWCRMTFKGGRRGDVVTVRYDERVRPDGEPTQRIERNDVPRRNRMELWPDSARVIDCFVFAVGSTNVLAGGTMQQDRFVLTGAAADRYEPRFTYHGFRYVWVRGTSELPQAVAREVRTDFSKRPVPDFGDADVNALVRMAARSYESNFTDGVPTDCPHREKNGWTGDAAAACEFAQQAFDNTEAYLKWIGDLVDAQRNDGAMPGVVPSGGWGWTEDGKYGYGPVWDGAVAFVPWMIYVYRDDDRGLRLAYPAIRRYVTHVERNLGMDGLVPFGLGDWITCGHYTDQRFCGTAYYYGLLQIAEKTARLHGEAAVAAEYGRLAVRVRRDFNRAYWRGGGQYADGYQTQQALPLTFGLCPEDARTSVAAKLVAAVHAADDHIDFGLVGSKHVFRALSEAGRTDLALMMLKQRTNPSFLCWRDAGSSTLWEDWETGFSRNHVMFGDFAAWAYQHLLGRRLPPGGTPAVPDPAVRGL